MSSAQVRLLICDQVDVADLSLGGGFSIDYEPGLPRDELLRVVSGYDAIIVRSRTKVDREVLDRATRLRLVARPGTGLDNVDVDYAKSKGIAVVNSPESLVEAVAEHVTLLMLALSRKLVEADLTTKAGGWEKERLIGSELKGKTLGIVGLGRIGRRIGEIAKVMGMSILVYDVVAIPPDVVARLECAVVDLDALFTGADYITLHVPMTDDTRHMVDSRRLTTMKPGSFIINTSRGGVIDEAALADALVSGKLGGAALDVFEKEPPVGDILKAPNVVLTPHVGGQTKEAQLSAITVVGEKIRTFFRVA